MKEKILKLRAAGYTYNQIRDELGCSKSTIAYHCGVGQKEKVKKRIQNRRKKSVISQRVEHFHYRYDRKVKDKTEDFQRERIVLKGRRVLGKRSLSFKWQDVIEKFGWETTCYLTGKEINLREPKTYQFDHVIPYSKGGTSEMNNLGIVCREANQAKHDMSVDEFIDLCKRVLEHNGYTIEKRY